jgi:hypothetical protein
VAQKSKIPSAWPWSLVHDPWSLALGPCPLGPGSWSLVAGLWFLVPPSLLRSSLIALLVPLSAPFSPFPRFPLSSLPTSPPPPPLPSPLSLPPSLPPSPHPEFNRKHTEFKGPQGVRGDQLAPTACRNPPDYFGGKGNRDPQHSRDHGHEPMQTYTSVAILAQA